MTSLPRSGRWMGVHTPGAVSLPQKRTGVNHNSPSGEVGGGSSTIRGPSRLGGLVQLVVDVEPFQDEFRGAGGGGVAGVGVGQLGQELPGQLVGLLLEAGDAIDPLKDLLRRLGVANLD